MKNSLLELGFALLHLVPKNLVSYLVGEFVRLRFPQPIQSWLCQTFAQRFGINMAEAEKFVDQYSSIEDLFVRALKPGLRPIKGAYCSPADGYLAISSPAANGTAVQAKGLTYDLAEVSGAPAGSDLAWFTTVYLAPHNYHRVHAPISGKLLQIEHVPGELWPVNQPSVARVLRLFVRNERLIFTLRTDNGGKCYVVMVGALNVGRMESPFLPGFATNDLKQSFSPSKSIRPFDALPVKAGEHLGTFLLGSTVVVVFDRKALELFRPVQESGNRPILLGESLEQ